MPSPGRASPCSSDHAESREAFLVLDGELMLRLDDDERTLGRETWAFVSRRLWRTRLFVAGAEPGAHPPHHWFPGAEARLRGRRSPCRRLRKATHHRPARSDAPPCSSRPRSSRSRSSTTGRASEERRGTSIASMRTRSSSLEGEFTFHLRDGSRIARRGHARRLPARRRARLRQRLGRAHARASTSTCRRSASRTTCAGGIPTSTSSTRPRTAASIRRPLSSHSSRGNVAA